MRKQKKQTVRWVGLAGEFGGYGGSNLSILKALRNSSKLKVLSSEYSQTSPQPSPVGNVATVGVAYLPGNCNWIEALGDVDYRILFSMFEADRWPELWVEAANCANEVWVPSAFCLDSLLASGCDRPVKIMPLGIDLESYFVDDAKVESDVFTFGFAGAASTRKGFDILLRAFQDEFRADEPVRLAIRSSSILSSTLPADVRIKADMGAVSIEAMRQFYQCVDLLVLPTRGEGFALTPLEAMACGTCAAVTAWGGSLDYLGDYSLKIGVDCLEECPGYHRSTGRWAKPSVASVRYCMRWAYENRKKVREMGRKAAEVVARDWTYAKTALPIEKAISEADLTERIEVQSRDVVVWRGDPAFVTTPVGGFTRGQPRELTPQQIERLNPSDMQEKGFVEERRYSRMVSR
jgi:hypothetical protein